MRYGWIGDERVCGNLKSNALDDITANANHMD